MTGKQVSTGVAPAALKDFSGTFSKIVADVLDNSSTIRRENKCCLSSELKILDKNSVFR